MKKGCEIGERYGKLVVLRFVEKRGEHRVWECRCDCGNIVNRVGASLRSNRRKHISCGCYIKKYSKLPSRGKINIDYPHIKYLVALLTQIKQRCYNANYKLYSRYGGRGIKMCQEWLDDTEIFCKWAIENGFEKGLTIDRIDNDKGYSPENCRWANILVQCNNRTSNRILIYNGVAYTAANLARQTGLTYWTFMQRLNKMKWPLEKIMTTPARKIRLPFSQPTSTLAQ